MTHSRQIAELRTATPVVSQAAGLVPRVESGVIQSVYTVRYEWDEAKNLRNQRDHDGITFELAALVFEDEFCLIGADRIDSVTGEQRWDAIGAVQNETGEVAVLLVVHVYREQKWRRNHPHHLGPRG